MKKIMLVALVILVTVSSVFAAIWYWPASGRVTSLVGYRWGSYHAGTDVANASGTYMYAPLSGRVTVAGWVSGYGYVVYIDNYPRQARTGHMSSIGVRRGTWKSARSYIGRMGSTGHSTGPHVHFETRKYGRAMKPAVGIGRWVTARTSVPW